MICFRDMTYCRSDCINEDCPRSMFQHASDRMRLKQFEELGTAWCDFSKDCPDYKQPPPEVA